MSCKKRLSRRIGDLGWDQDGPDFMNDEMLSLSLALVEEVNRWFKGRIDESAGSTAVLNRVQRPPPPPRV